MNWVLLAVLLVLALCIVRGYRRGFLRSIYSLISWVLVLSFVSWATPHIKTYLMENTSLCESLREHFKEYIRDAAVQNAQAEEAPGGAYAQFGIQLPETVLDNLFGAATETTDRFLEESGVYESLANGMAELAIEGISFVAALAAAWLLVGAISRLLGIVSHIPVISGLNRFLGLFAGGLYGLALVSLAFYAIALFSASKWGSALVGQIYRNPFLAYLYENNVIFLFVLRYF